jgi:hypothetical protein
MIRLATIFDFDQGNQMQIGATPCVHSAEARRIAANIAKLPELLRKPWMPWSLLRRGDDSCFQKAERRRNI